MGTTHATGVSALHLTACVPAQADRHVLALLKGAGIYPGWEVHSHLQCRHTSRVAQEDTEYQEPKGGSTFSPVPLPGCSSLPTASSAGGGREPTSPPPFGTLCAPRKAGTELSLDSTECRDSDSACPSRKDHADWGGCLVLAPPLHSHRHDLVPNEHVFQESAVVIAK